jgi:hypothetical protein
MTVQRDFNQSLVYINNVMMQVRRVPFLRPVKRKPCHNRGPYSSLPRTAYPTCNNKTKAIPRQLGCFIRRVYSLDSPDIQHLRLGCLGHFQISHSDRHRWQMLISAFLLDPFVVQRYLGQKKIGKAGVKAARIDLPCPAASCRFSSGSVRGEPSDDALVSG